MRKSAVPALLILILALSFTGSASAQDQQGPAVREEAVPQTPEEIIEGRGEREMVLIHGLGGNAEIWDECLPFLQGTFRVWTFELAGHGHTQPIMDPTIDKEVDRLAAFLKEQDIVYPTLVGHGMGGMIALKYTIEHPADVHRLIVLDAAPMQLASQEQKAAVGRELAVNYDDYVFTRFANMTPDVDVTERIIDMALRTDSATFISLLMSSFDFDVSDQLYSMPVPMLVVGSELMFPSYEDSQQMLEQYGFGKARALSFKRMGGTGHFMMIERPIYLASVLLAFGVSGERQFEH